MILVNLATATICFMGGCHPVLYGKETPQGEFRLQNQLTHEKGYGGDILSFYEDDYAIFAIHRLYLRNKEQNRDKRIKSSKKEDKIITNGCINVDNAVYEKLKDCCSSDKLVIYSNSINLEEKYFDSDDAYRQKPWKNDFYEDDSTGAIGTKNQQTGAPEIFLLILLFYWKIPEKINLLGIGKSQA